MSAKSDKKDNWYDRIFKGVPADFPPACKVALDKEHTVFFLEDHPREVIAGYKRPTMVIPVNMDKKKCSLFLSNVDLARQVWNIEDQARTLKGITIKMTKKRGPGRSYRYQVDKV
jgi:hypothetical protein